MCRGCDLVCTQSFASTEIAKLVKMWTATWTVLFSVFVVMFLDQNCKWAPQRFSAVPLGTNSEYCTELVYNLILSFNYFATRSTQGEPFDDFDDMRATTPNDRAGETVFERKYLLDVPYRNEVDNMEAELTALAMLLLNMVERGHYEVDVYTDCAELIPYMRPRSELPERPVVRRLVVRCRTLIRHAHTHGRKVTLRHVRRGWNKRADALTT